MKRRLVEESSLFASFVEDAKRREPPPEALRGLLRTLESRPAAADPPALRGRLARIAIAGAGGVALLGVVTSQLWPRSAPPAEPPPEINVSPTSEAAPPAQPTANGVPSIAVDDLPDSKAAAPRARSPQGAPPSVAQPTPSARPSARREIELVAEAREALSRGDARACLDAVERHRREFPAGQLTLEMKVMQIEATLASGDRAGARALAQDYLAKNPGSAYEARVRSLAASTEAR